MRRILLLFLLPLLAGFHVIGRAETAPDSQVLRDEKGRIIVEFWHGMSNVQGRCLNSLIDQFNTSQEKYVVKGIYQGGYDSLSQKLIASLYAGRAPAASQMYESWATRFLKYGYLRPVEDFLASDKSFDKKDLVPVFLEDSTYEVEGRGRILATLPFNKSVYVLYVNQTLMEEVGWTKPPATWAELRELAKAMTKRSADGTIERHGFAARPLIESFTVFFMGTGANYMNEAGDFTFTGEEGRSAMKEMVGLVQGADGSGYVEPEYLNVPFGSGRLGMYTGSTASFTFNDSAVQNKFIWRAYPIPGREAGKGRVLCQGTNVGIFSLAPEVVQEGAWQFLSFLASVEGTSKWAMETGYMPVRTSAAEYGPMKEYLGKNQNFSAAFGSLQRGMFEPKVIYWDSVRSAFQREIDAVLKPTHPRSPDDAIDRVAAYCKAVAAANK